MERKEPKEPAYPNPLERFAEMEGRYFIRTLHGAQFLDLLSGRPLQPGQMPPSMLEMPLTAAGFDYLLSPEMRGKTVQLILAYHGGSHHLADIVRQHQPVLDSASVVGVEMDWDMQSGHDIPLLRDVSPKLATAEGRAEFQTAQLQLLSSQGKHILPCDHSSDDVLYQTMLTIYQLYRDATANADGALDEHSRNAIRVITKGIVQCNRQWAILGQFGYWVKQARLEGLLPDTETHLPLILGSWHAPSQQRLESLGVRTEVYETSHADQLGYGGYESTYMNIVSSGQVTHDQLAIQLPY